MRVTLAGFDVWNHPTCCHLPGEVSGVRSLAAERLSLRGVVGGVLPGVLVAEAVVGGGRRAEDGEEHGDREGRALGAAGLGGVGAHATETVHGRDRDSEALSPPAGRG